MDISQMEGVQQRRLGSAGDPLASGVVYLHHQILGLDFCAARCSERRVLVWQFKVLRTLLVRSYEP